MKKNRIIGIDGYCYSSLFNYKLISKLLNIDNIYQKYVRVIKRIFKYMKTNNINEDNSEIRKTIFDKFSPNIEKFCFLNFNLLDMSLFYDLFNRLMYDIYYRLNLIKIIRTYYK